MGRTFGLFSMQACTKLTACWPLASTSASSCAVLCSQLASKLLSSCFRLCMSRPISTACHCICRELLLCSLAADTAQVAL